MVKLKVLAIPAAFLALGAAMHVLQKNIDKDAPTPKAPVIRDVNGDGIPDKVLEKLVWESIIETETLYGIGEINGKLVYLPKNAYERYKKGELN